MLCSIILLNCSLSHCTYTRLRGDKLQKAFSDYKTTVQKIQKDMEMMVEDFDKKFEKYISVFTITPNKSPFLIKEYNCMQSTSYDIEVELKYLCLRQWLRRLFFGEFILFFNEFNTRVYLSIIKNQKPEKCLNFHSVKKLVYSVYNEPCFSAEKRTAFDFLSIDKSKYKNYNFLFFLKKLEDLVIKHTNNTRENLRKCLYYDRGFSFDVNSDENIMQIYSLYMASLSFYIPFCPEEKTLCLSGSYYYYLDKCFPRFKSDKKDLRQKFSEIYSGYINLDIVLEYDNCLQKTEDSRFQLYRKEQKKLNPCCVSKGKNLFKTFCKKHGNLINQMIEYFFDINLLMEEYSIFNRNIILEFIDVEHESKNYNDKLYLYDWPCMSFCS
ncbi:hypothetical protein CDIK_3117 [Cucumispora dikerogammari]|nr:hypothetical protein CDIK_3117 [Cucumispora dikerogammari]